MARDANNISECSLRLAMTPGIGPVLFRRLLDAFGSAEAIVGAKAAGLRAVEGIGTRRASQILGDLDSIDVRQEIAKMQEAGVSFIACDSPSYPPLLKTIPDPPIGLWVRGELADEDAVSIAIVGSRRCTAYGRDQAGRFASLLAQSGLTIVSGGARGIDGEAHRAALRVNGRTIVVCGCGLSHTYPPEHKDLFDRIVSEGRGAIISEYPMETAPRAEHFPRRNRIISGLSLGVLVIEAGKGSGALITARVASEEHNREVMALPGRLDSPASLGCLEAIRDGWAGMVLNHADVLLQLDSTRNLLRGAFETGVDGPGDGSAEPSLFAGGLTDVQQSIVNALQENGETLSLDQLTAATQMPINTLMAELTILQIRRVVSRTDRGVRLARTAQGAD